MACRGQLLVVLRQRDDRRHVLTPKEKERKGSYNADQGSKGGYTPTVVA